MSPPQEGGFLAAGSEGAARAAEDIVRATQGMDAELESLIREHLDGTLDGPGRDRLAARLAGDPGALAEFADQLGVHHRLRVLLAEGADPVTRPVLREVRWLADAPRFSREVVARIKALERRGAPVSRPALAWAAAVFAAVLGAVFFLPGRAPEAAVPVVVAVTADVVLEREGRAGSLPIGAALRAGDGVRIPAGGFLAARFPGVAGRLEAGPGRLTALGGAGFRLHEGPFGAALPGVLETPHGKLQGGASGWASLSIDASGTRVSAEGSGVRFVRADGSSVEIPAGREARIGAAGEVVPVAFRREVLFVVGGEPPGPGDAAVRERLERELHAAVVVRSAAEASAADAAGKACVVISSTALAREVVEPAGDLRNKFRNVEVPVLTWEPRIFFDLGMIPGARHKADWAAARGRTHLWFSGLAHPLSAGFAGSVRVAREGASFSWGRPRTDALRVAALEGAEDAWAIFAYERGAPMPGGAAPARRVGFFLFDETAPVLTPEGWALFDAAVRWCAADRP